MIRSWWMPPLTFASALAAAASLSATVSAQLPLAHVSDVALTGGATRLDYQAIDPRKHLLFIAHLGDSEVIVIDTKTRRVVATIPKVSRVHGVLAVQELNTLYASATGTNEVVAIDESTLRITARVAGGIYPDGLAFDPVTKHLFVSDERRGTETVIDTRSNRRIATIDLGGEVGNTQYDPALHHIFANVQTLGQVAEIDPANNAIVKRISLAGTGCTGNHGLLIDAQRRRAFIACEDNASFLWMDMRTMRVVRTWTIGESPDVLALDEGTQRLFVAAESGIVSVFSDNRVVARTAQAFLAPAAHTVAIDPRTHAVYFPLENIGGRPVLRIMVQTLAQADPKLRKSRAGFSAAKRDSGNGPAEPARR